VLSGISDWSSALYITLHSQSVIWLSFYQFLSDNYFCPWLMIVGGRPSTVILLEAGYHFYRVLDLSAGASLVSLTSLLASLTELLFGPALGLGLLVLWGYLSNKLFVLAYLKLINGRK
jgi:hypothetical protein